MSEPPEHCSPLETHCWVAGSQHPSEHGDVVPVQQLPPE
jgi:hypothetical protein